MTEWMPEVEAAIFGEPVFAARWKEFQDWTQKLETPVSREELMVWIETLENARIDELNYIHNTIQRLASEAAAVERAAQALSQAMAKAKQTNYDRDLRRYKDGKLIV